MHQQELQFITFGQGQKKVAFVQTDEGEDSELQHQVEVNRDLRVKMVKCFAES